MNSEVKAEKNKSIQEEKAAIICYYTKPNTTDARNRMGCSENWYDPYYAISQTFSLDEVEAMCDKEIDMLLRLADAMSDGLY